MIQECEYRRCSGESIKCSGMAGGKSIEADPSSTAFLLRWREDVLKVSS